MLKLIAVGVWGALVTVGTYMGLTHLGVFAPAPATEATVQKIETISTGVMRVPIMAGEAPSGYVMLNLDIDYDSQAVASIASKFPSIALDESFRAVYESVSIDFKTVKKTDLTGLLTSIGERLNKRVGSESVKELRIKEFMFVPPRRSRKS